MSKRFPKGAAKAPGAKKEKAAHFKPVKRQNSALSSTLLSTNTDSDRYLSDPDVSSILGYQPTVLSKEKKELETMPSMGRPIQVAFSDYKAILNAGHVRAMLMEDQAKESYERQTKEMNDELECLVSRNRSLVKELEELRMKDTTLKAKCEHVDQLVQQTESLKGCGLWMSEASKRLVTLGRALDTSVNILPSSKVAYSSDGKLEALLDETNQLLTEMEKMSFIKSNTLGKEAEVVDDLSRILAQENEDLLNCVELVISSTDSVITEATVLTK